MIKYSHNEEFVSIMESYIEKAESTEPIDDSDVEWGGRVVIPYTIHLIQMMNLIGSVTIGSDCIIDDSFFYMHLATKSSRLAQWSCLPVL